MGLGQAIQGNATVLRNYLRDLACYLQDGVVVVALAQQRNHIASEPTHLAVRKNGFEPITDLRPVLVIADCKQDHYTTVRPLVPDAPLLKKVIGEVLHRVTFQGLDGHQCYLGLSFLVDFRTQSRKSIHRRRVKHAGKIVDVSLYLELLPLFRVGWHSGNDSEEQKDEYRKGTETGRKSEASWSGAPRGRPVHDRKGSFL